MKVTCQICKKKIERDTAYKITTISPTNGTKTNKYYCSEEEWQSEQARKKKFIEDKDKVYRLICDMFGYEIQNTRFFSEWVLWNKLKSNEVIYKFINDKEDYLREICGKEYKNENAKIMYFSAILKNELHDYKPKPTEGVRVVPKVVAMEEECRETKYKPKVRQALLDFEEECDE